MAWIDLTGLGRYHENLKAWIDKIKYIHPANHPATMIIQDNNNQFVTKEQKANWTNKLDSDANAVSASKLYKSVKINGIEFDGTKDINLDVSNFYNEKTYISVLLKNTKEIIIPDKYWNSYNSIIVYVNGVKLSAEKNYSINSDSHNILLKEEYSYDTDIEIIFTLLDNNNSFSYELEPNIKNIKLEINKTINDSSVIHVYADGIKLIKNKHYTINFTEKTITLTESYEDKINLEILILKY